MEQLVFLRLFQEADKRQQYKNNLGGLSDVRSFKMEYN